MFPWRYTCIIRPVLTVLVKVEPRLTGSNYRRLLSFHPFVEYFILISVWLIFTSDLIPDYPGLVTYAGPFSPLYMLYDKMTTVVSTDKVLYFDLDVCDNSDPLDVDEEWVGTCTLCQAYKAQADDTVICLSDTDPQG